MKSYANKLGRISSEWKACALYGAEVSKASQLNKHEVVFDFEIAVKQLIHFVISCHFHAQSSLVIKSNIDVNHFMNRDVDDWKRNFLPCPFNYSMTLDSDWSKEQLCVFSISHHIDFCSVKRRTIAI